ncbi:hypothetical protein ACTXT7_009257 [Hymenolepis weldensis]
MLEGVDPTVTTSPLWIAIVRPQVAQTRMSITGSNASSHILCPSSPPYSLETSLWYVQYTLAYTTRCVLLLEL